MCGICGIVDLRASRPIDGDVVKEMVWAVRHRGPDELGLYVDECAGLGHARLSIVDLAGGAQPMANEDGTLWIVFNGEIYNHVELRPDLERRGHRFSSRCDTEVLLHLYEEYGARCVDHLNGQFGFAIWDRANRTVFMARDRFGIRPLYYATVGDRLVFASEIKSLLAVPEIRLAFDPIGLDQTFTFWSPVAPRTVFEGIRQLPAAHSLTATAGGIRTERYWTLEFPEEDAPAEESPQYYAERLRDELVQATRLRMRADVPVAAYLSGGLDSSFTAAVIQEYTEAPLTTFSVRFQDARFDEGEHQDTMVAHLGTDHRSITVGQEDIANAFPEVVWHAETPILRTAPVPLHHLSGLVRENGIKVVVTGEGADEVLAGYNIFKEAKIRRFWARHPNSALRPLLLTRLYPYLQRQEGRAADAFWQRFFGMRLTETDHPCYSHLLRWGNGVALKRFFTPDLRAAIGEYDAIAEYAATLPDGFETWAPLSKAQYVEIQTFMTGYLLCSQGDRVSMSHSVEGRFPFLDHHVAEFAATIPPRHKLRVLEEKHVLRKAAQTLVPDSVRSRVKQPYRAPDSASFLGSSAPDFVRDALSEDAVRAAGCFEPGRVTRLVDKCCRMEEAGVSPRDDMALVGVLSAQLLHERFLGTSRHSDPVDDRQFAVRARVPRGDLDQAGLERSGQ